MQECPVTVFPRQLRWETDGTSRIPFQAYTDEQVYRQELDRFFYRGHWCYAGLEAEIPNAGDFKRTVVGERSVLMVRDKDGSIHVVENVCAHRGMAFCRERHGNRESLTCPYHQWNYRLDGALQGGGLRHRAGHVPGALAEELERPVVGLCLHVLRQGEQGRPVLHEGPPALAPQRSEHRVEPLHRPRIILRAAVEG